MLIRWQVNGSEDCLYLGLYSRPWTTSQPLRPVIVVFYGGGFIQGSASFTLPPSAYPVLNVSDTNDFVVVYPNYRVNAFGLLPGKEIAEDPKSDLNPGLLDQDTALRWTNKYSQYFETLVLRLKGFSWP
jgi:carboxylesterase type B